MENLNEFQLTATSEQLEYLIELVTCDVASSKMTLNALKIPFLKERLELRINAHMLFLEYLKAKQDVHTAFIPATSY